MLRSVLIQTYMCSFFANGSPNSVCEYTQYMRVYSVYTSALSTCMRSCSRASSAAESQLTCPRSLAPFQSVPALWTTRRRLPAPRLPLQGPLELLALTPRSPPGPKTVPRQECRGRLSTVGLFPHLLRTWSEGQYGRTLVKGPVLTSGSPWRFRGLPLSKH